MTEEKQNSDLPKEENIKPSQDKKAIKKKRIKTGFMIAGLAVPLLGLIIIPSVLNNPYNYKKTLLISDTKNLIASSTIDEQTNDNQKTYLFTQTTKNVVEEVMNPHKTVVNLKSTDKLTNYKSGLLYSYEFKLQGNNDKVDWKELANFLNNESEKVVEINSDQQITYLELNIEDLLKKYQEKYQKEILASMFINSITQIVISTTYFYQDEENKNKYYFYDNKPRYIGFAITNFFQNATKDLTKNKQLPENTRSTKNNVIIKANLTLNEDIKTIKDMNFISEMKINVLNEVNNEEK
ncbi:hypothetical protein FJO69_00755 [[Mycoplasma] falconis]|uniref:Uncharacterized protein n=1 Tax=[Mycoplasma] falconis TaxID=92403 RepID=A0A501XBH8_9BACT|nr:hypothetical protein [[Mycoplasma] falconis]TPE57713.1 hypothetical protein FJO69_00755 [[Mycoplasma] falconis]